MKKSSSRPTVSIGIPAHNEEKNLPFLLESIFHQQTNNHVLEKVYVLCDGCTDKTADVAKEKKKKFPAIVIKNDGKRTGKAVRLNQIYDLNKSDLLLTIDADCLLERDCEIDLLVQGIQKSPNTLLVGPRYIPFRNSSLMGRFAEYSYLSLEDAILQYNDGKNMYALMGCASLLKKKLADSFHYPADTVSDQNYLFAQATQKDLDAFNLVKEAHMLFRTVSTFHDWRLLSARSVVGDKADVVKHFGESVLENYSLPRELYIRSLIKWFFKNPFYLTGSVVMNIIIRLFPYEQGNPQHGQWETTASSKEAIQI